MAWTSNTGIWTQTSTTSGNTLSGTTTAQATAPGVIIVMVATDNTGTTDADNSEISSVTDGTNTYSKAVEWTNGEGAAGSGATVSVWYTVITSNLASGTTITVNFANNVTAKAGRAVRHGITSGSKISIAGTPQKRTDDQADVGALTLSGLTNKEYLFLRASALEHRSATAWTATTSYTNYSVSVADTGTANTSMALRGEFRILTGTGDTSDPTLASTTPDSASVYIAFNETYTTSPSGAISTITGALTDKAKTAYSGAISSIVGSITKKSKNAYSGSISTITGALTNKAKQVLSGAISTITGALTNIAKKFVSLSGAFTPAGALTNKAKKVLSGAITPAGTIAKAIYQRGLAGTLTLAGAITNKTKRLFAGTIASAGALSTAITRALSVAGSILSAGSLSNIAKRVLSVAGSITPSAALQEKVKKVLSGSIASAGTITNKAKQILGGTIALAGSFSRVLTLVGQVTFAGAGRFFVKVGRDVRHKLREALVRSN